ncbi:SDR family NAD(P)-dependent oxidoreductase [Streptomyces sp. NPDC002018]|uniref:SDR family NAD(P)-dependent oxidoreductase n=1 Tax=Streptomyces sp. NPDC002018 TaxID=3364629 RepID=UPI0036B2D262
MTTAQDIAGKNALVTGSTSGIGRATAMLLAGQGAYVLVTGRGRQRGEEVVDTIRAAGGKADFLLADLSDARSADDLAELALATTGGRIDILVNNAAIGALGATAGFDEALYDSHFTLNVKVPFRLVGAIAPTMAQHGSGAIVNITSMAGQFAIPGMAVYGACKAALGLLTKNWAAEFGPSGVRVNAVSPGTTRTPFVAPLGDALDELAAQSPLGYVADPAEIASAIAYLAGDDASFVNGVVLNVDGGRTAI